MANIEIPGRTLCFSVIMLICSLLTVNGRSLESMECMTGPEHDYRQAWYQSDWCCDSCQNGQHMTEPCIRGQPDTTQCDWCESDTYTAYPNLLDNCNPQGHCDLERQEIKTPASITTKLECECKSGYYELIGGGCAHWIVCKKGFGVLHHGTEFDDVICQSCSDGTYSDKDDISMECLPHTRCDDVGMTTIREGTRKSDAICGPVTESPVDVQTEKSPEKPGDYREDMPLMQNDSIPLAIHSGTMHFEEQNTNDSSFWSTEKYILVCVSCVLSAIIAIGILRVVYGYRRLRRRQRSRRNVSDLQMELTVGPQSRSIQPQPASPRHQDRNNTIDDDVIHDPPVRYDETQTRTKNNAEPISNVPNSLPSTDSTNTAPQENSGGQTNIIVNNNIQVNVEGPNTRPDANCDRSSRPPNGAGPDIHTGDDEETQAKQLFGESLTEGHAETGEPKHKTSQRELREARENAAKNVDSRQRELVSDSRQVVMCTEDPEHNIDDVFEKEVNYALPEMQPLITPKTRRRESELSDGASNCEEDREFSEEGT